jgi:hypothetical protein
MSKAKRFTRCVFIPAAHREHLPRGAVVVDVSSYADAPLCTLSPMWVHGGIPIPGMPGATSDPVEGIWQGLKVIRGKTAPRYFSGPGQKRGGKPSGHQYGGKLLGIVEARHRIYRVAYEWVLANRVEPGLIEGFVERAFRGEAQFFHDVCDNGDINNADAPFAHAALVAQYVNRLCTERAEGKANGR